MRSSSLLFLAAVLGTAIAGGSQSPSPTSEAPAPQSTEWVEWSTTTVYSTLHDTVTSYATVTGPTVTETEVKTVTQVNTVSATGPTTTETVSKTITQVNTITQTSTVTTSPAPVTVTSVQTIPQTIVQTITQTVSQTAVQTIPQTVEETVQRTATVTVPATAVTVTVTVVQTVRQTVGETVQNTVVRTATVEETATVNNVVTATITSVSRVTDFVSAPASCPSSLSGLVTCPTRIINPTYTPPAPLPSGYLWGCPPGKLCRPKREDCNFEQNPPADSYFCAPEECLPVAQLPSLEAFLSANQASNESCAWLTPSDDYFNLNPLFFGHDFGIFNIYGQPTCTTTPAANTVTVVVSNSCAAGSTPTPTPSASWSKTSWSSSPHVTKRAELSERKLEKKQVVVGQQCYAPCDYAGYVYQSMGRVPELCNPDSPWNSALNAVEACTEEFAATGVTSVASILNEPLIYCDNLAKRWVRGRRA